MWKSGTGCGARTDGGNEDAGMDGGRCGLGDWMEVVRVRTGRRQTSDGDGQMVLRRQKPSEAWSGHEAR